VQLDQDLAAEIVTGERLQSLAETTLLPGAIALRQHEVKPDASRTIVVHEHSSIEGEQLRSLSESRSLFVYADALALFQEHVWPRLSGRGYVLIANNSDDSVGREQLPWVERAGGKLGHWFAQNLVAEHPKLTPLPIGLANSSWEHGDVEALCAARASAEHTGLVHARFFLGSHPDRERAWKAVTDAFPEVAAEPALSHDYGAYLAELGRHRFCICPRGNGVDTHRFWECQYLGVVPVVERSPHIEIWERLDLPMLVLDDWSELSRARLEAEERPAPQAMPPQLCLSHYARLVREAEAKAER
jgi:hypothetical protein